MSLKIDVRVEREYTTGGKVSSSKDEVNRAIRNIATSLNHDQMQEMLSEIGDIYYDSIMTRFRSHTNPQGQSWKHLQKETVHLKREGQYSKSGRLIRGPAVKSVSPRRGAAIAVSPETQLIWTGKLLRAIRVVKDYRRGTLAIGLDSRQVPYAWVHQMGYAWRNIPMRKFLGYTKVANQQAMAVVRRYLQQRTTGTS